MLSERSVRFLDGNWKSVKSIPPRTLFTFSTNFFRGLWEKVNEVEKLQKYPELKKVISTRLILQTPGISNSEKFLYRQPSRALGRAEGGHEVTPLKSTTTGEVGGEPPGANVQTGSATAP